MRLLALVGVVLVASSAIGQTIILHRAAKGTGGPKLTDSQPGLSSSLQNLADQPAVNVRTSPELSPIVKPEAATPVAASNSSDEPQVPYGLLGACAAVIVVGTGLGVKAYSDRLKTRTS